MAESLIRIEVAPTVGEGIRGDVEDPHHARPVEANLAGPMAPDLRGVRHSAEQRRIPISRCSAVRQELYTSERSAGGPAGPAPPRGLPRVRRGGEGAQRRPRRPAIETAW